MSRTLMSAQTVDVAIVGYGPVGAFTALLLAEQGLRVVVLERETGAVELPRAVALDGESLRAFQRVGLGDVVHAIVQPSRNPDEVWFTDSKRERIFGLEVSPLGHNGWRDVMYFDQPELEALLRELVAKQPQIDVRLGHEVTGLSQDADGVTIEARCAAGARAWRAAVAIGCDGASSFVRRALGIAWESLGYDQDWLVVDVLERPGSVLPKVLMQVCDPARLTTYVCVKDPNRRWEFRLLPGETREEMLRPERIRALLAPWVAPEHYTLRRAAVYQFHAATAARWQQGRIFLAGDAAHQTPPFLGQGLNAGFRDAVNLGWKLPLVLRGVCGAGLLETYAAERDAHARDLVERAVDVGRLMETLAAREAGLPDPHPPAAPRPDDGPGPAAPPLRDGVIVTEQSGLTQPVGRLLRQPTVRRSDGRVCRLDALLGRGFALLGRKQSDVQLGPDAARVLERLGGRAVSLEGIEVVEGSLDALFDRHAAVVLRPDRYVFGVASDGWDVGRLIGELSQKLALR